MSTTRLPNHISQQFDNELQDIRSKVLAMGGLVEQHLEKVLSFFSKGELEGAEYVAVSDYLINALEVEIDLDCSDVLVKRQPAAGDLRLVLAVSKTITDLERMGDEIEKIARLIIHEQTVLSGDPYYHSVSTLGKHVALMVRNSLDTFARMDSGAALQVAMADREIDIETGAILRELMTYMMEDPRKISPVLDVILAVRAFERVGDHAKNVAENVIYLVEGRNVRHVSLEQIQKELEQGD
jgi:phosphate transport system protein